MTKFKIVLYKDSDCDLCKAVQEELVNNPPQGELIVKHTKHEATAKEAEMLGISSYPCIILKDSETDECVHRFYGFTTSELIDYIINRL